MPSPPSSMYLHLQRHPRISLGHSSKSFHAYQITYLSPPLSHTHTNLIRILLWKVCAITSNCLILVGFHWSKDLIFLHFQVHKKQQSVQNNNYASFCNRRAKRNSLALPDNRRKLAVSCCIPLFIPSGSLFPQIHHTAQQFCRFEHLLFAVSAFF